MMTGWAFNLAAGEVDLTLKVLFAMRALEFEFCGGHMVCFFQSFIFSCVIRKAKGQRFLICSLSMIEVAGGDGDVTNPAAAHDWRMRSIAAKNLTHQLNHCGVTW